MDFTSILDELVATVVVTLLVFIATRFRSVWFGKMFGSEQLFPPEPAPPQSAKQVSCPSFPDGLTPRERAKWLQTQADHHALDDLAFLLPNDCIKLLPNDCIKDLILTRRVGGGRTTVVWEAWSEDLDKKVAVKFLRRRIVDDRSAVDQFKSSAKLLHDFRSESVAGALGKPQAWPSERAPLTYFYVLEFCEGTPLTKFALEYPERRTEVVRALAKLACELDKAHEQGVVFRDLTPADLMVDAPRLVSDPGRAVRLMDFDSVAKESALTHLAVTLGFSAPEAFEYPDEVDRRADIFSLARIIAYVYHGGPLPNAYTLSSAEISNLLNCPARIKQLLIRSTSHHKTERPESLRAFSEELEAALATGPQPLFFATILHERRKIYPLVAQGCIGTTVAVALTRWPLWLWPGVHLSDTPWVATFHGIIGGLTWGGFHTAFFILYLILIRNRYGSRPAVATLFGGAGGLIAGMIIALPSVLVTHPDALLCLGWITPLTIGDSYLNVQAGARMATAIFETRMAWSYPITGLLTGIGVALCLDRGISIALKASPSGSGVLPVPTKDETMPVAALKESLGKVLGAWQSYLYLAFPLIFAFLAMLVLHPHMLDSKQLEDLRCNVHPEPLRRAIGEGANHFLGVIGLMTGFFYRVPLVKPIWR
jgi:hypothetical protein